MSYEGYEQHICAGGHLFTNNDLVSGMYDDSWKAKCHCGQESVFCNSVDETNCESFGIIPPEEFAKLFQGTNEKVEVCNLGHQHFAPCAVYRIPQEGELKRYFRTPMDKYLPIESYQEYWNDIFQTEKLAESGIYAPEAEYDNDYTVGWDDAEDYEKAFSTERSHQEYDADDCDCSSCSCSEYDYD